MSRGLHDGDFMPLSLARREWSVGWIVSTSLILAATLLAAAPALLGDWVYDDRAIPVSQALDDIGDVREAFTRSSEDYFAALRTPGQTASAPVATGVTYRPLPMLSLSLVNVALGASPLFHHLLGALFHIACVLLLARLFRAEGQLTPRGWLVVTAFAAHPCFVEAWGWINGRSDVMAGLALLALDAALRPLVPTRRYAGLSLLALITGALCKETFVVAAAFVLASAHVRRARQAGAAPRRAWVTTAGLWLITTVAMLAARRAVVGADASNVEFDLMEVFSNAPHLIALGLEALAVPHARSMRLLSWELGTAWTAFQFVAVTAAVVLALVLLRARRWDRLALLAGAGATLLPALLISGGFWFGFDRYLYMPAILIALASVPDPTEVPATRRPPRWVSGTVYVAMATVLILTTRKESTAYASQSAFERSMVELRPGDPSGYLNAFRETLARGDQTHARHLLAAMPTIGLPLPHAHRAASGWLSLGEPERAAHTAQAAIQAHGPEPRLLIGLARARAAQGHWQEACTLLERAYEATPAKRTAVLVTLERAIAEEAQTQLPPDAAVRLRSLGTLVRQKRESAARP